ncbi:MAG TPA: hypothetical protein VHA74_03460 [Candidatus Dojkabacteria bacterium]|nr:hypothetical protein [Candidatus Dojkabacteria bacterium]
MAFDHIARTGWMGSPINITETPVFKVFVERIKGMCIATTDGKFLKDQDLSLIEVYYLMVIIAQLYSETYDKEVQFPWSFPKIFPSGVEASTKLDEYDDVKTVTQLPNGGTTVNMNYDKVKGLVAFSISGNETDHTEEYAHQMNVRLLSEGFPITLEGTGTKFMQNLEG